jgi:hypothetical protein
MTFLTGKIATYVTGGLLAIIVILALALTITRGTLHKRTDALHTEQQAHRTDIATWQAAVAKAKADDAEHARQVEQQQAQITQDTEHDLQTQLADARSIADRWMRDHAATDDSGGSGGASMSEPPDAARNANLAAAQALVSGADIDACATDYVIAKGWQDWWSKVQPVWQSGSASGK